MASRTAHPRTLRQDAAANRERLLVAAQATIRREGVGVPMAATAAEAAVGVGTLYRHFADRDELLDELTRRSFERVLALAERCDRDDRPGIDCVEVFFTGTIAHRDTLFLPLHGGTTQLSKDTRAVQRKLHAVFRRIVDRGIADASMRPDVTVWDIVSFAALLAQGLPTITNWPSVAARLADIHLAGLRPPGSTISSPIRV